MLIIITALSEMRRILKQTGIMIHEYVCDLAGYRSNDDRVGAMNIYQLAQCMSLVICIRDMVRVKTKSRKSDMFLVGYIPDEIKKRALSIAR